MKIQLLLLGIIGLCLSCETSNEKPIKENRSEIHLAKANDYLMNSDFQKASIHLDSLLLEDSLNTNKSAWYGKGVASEMLGDYESAIQFYSKAISIDPNFTMAYYKRGNSKKMIGDNASALVDLKKSIELKPDLTVAIVEVAHMVAKPGKVEQTIVEMMSNSINLNSGSDVLFQFRGHYRYYLDDTKGAIEDFNQSLKLNEKNIESLYYSGVIYGEMKEYSKAIENLTKAIELNNGYKLAYVHRGVYYFNTEEFEKACADFKKANELGESSAQKYINDHCQK